ncbi:MAG: 6-phosphogluconolactonase [Candidatus Rhabdochlamydia sp.]
MISSHVNIHIEKNLEAAIHFTVNHLIACYQHAVDHHGFFTLALSGGSTPVAIYQLLCSSDFASKIAWDKVHLFWSDERAVPPSSLESNYRMAMESGFKFMPIPPHQIHRMVAEDSIHHHAEQYENLLHQTLFQNSFDLILLGMGDDGHTASLFPSTQGVLCTDRQVIANYIPSKNSWRMTLSFPCLHQAQHTVFTVFGSSKAKMINQVFNSSHEFPCQNVGSKLHPALWIMDQEAAKDLQESHAF